MTKNKSLLMVLMFVVFYLPTIGLSQQTWRDVVYLKSGSVIKGVIIEQIPNESIKIETSDGSIFVIQMEEISKITREPMPGTGTQVNLQQPALPLGNAALVINPLGFIQFGPVVDFEFKVVKDFFMFPHLRWSSMGLLYQLIATEGGEWSLDPTTMAAGWGFKRFFGNPANPNKGYTSLILEYGWGKSYGDQGSSYEWENKFSYFTIIGNIGYRWRFNKFLLNLGFDLGVAPELTDEWWYVNDPGDIHENSIDLYAVYMLEFSFGWEF